MYHFSKFPFLCHLLLRERISWNICAHGRPHKSLFWVLWSFYVDSQSFELYQSKCEPVTKCSFCHVADLTFFRNVSILWPNFSLVIAVLWVLSYHSCLITFFQNSSFICKTIGHVLLNHLKNYCNPYGLFHNEFSHFFRLITVGSNVYTNGRNFDHISCEMNNFWYQSDHLSLSKPRKCFDDKVDDYDSFESCHSFFILKDWIVVLMTFMISWL